MTVRELIKCLLEYPMNEEVIIKKELDYNIWVRSDVKFQPGQLPILTFDFPTEKFEIKRK